nr:ribonuclease 2-like isoform X2 [Ipomoea batatas]
MNSLPILPLLLLFGSFCSTLTHGGGDAEALKLQEDQREFDLFKLALQWPGTECKGTSKCCSNNGCCRADAIIGFTIHGLWADYEDGTWPSCCEGSEFDENVEVLIGAGYVPSNSEKYPLEGIISAIQNAFHMTPEVTCSSKALEEVRLCFDKNFEPRDCETESNTESGLTSLKSSSCPSNVSLPIYDTSQWLESNEAVISQSSDEHILIEKVREV